MTTRDLNYKIYHLTAIWQHPDGRWIVSCDCGFKIDSIHLSLALADLQTHVMEYPK